MRRSLILLGVVGVGCPAPAPPPPVAPRLAAPEPSALPATARRAETQAAPSAHEPPLRLPRSFVPTGYDVHLALEPGKPTFAGTATITGDAKETSPVIWLHGRHLTVTRASAVGATPATLAVTLRGDDLLEVRADPPLPSGSWQLAFDYTGEIDRINTTGVFEESIAGTPYVYSQFEATYARRAFPCIDEPDLKVPWRLVLDIPEKLVAASNTPVAQETALGDGKKRIEFVRTKPLPSYLVAFAVGPFDIADGGKTRSGVPVRVLTPKGRAGEAAYAAKTAARALDALEDWFAMPFPFEKMDLVVVPLTVGFGAMENAGMVTYSEHNVLLDPARASWQRKQRVTRVIAHELSHQWFGDLVTMAWWDDLWLNEGFANWMETKIVAKLEPAWRTELHVIDEHQTALAADSLVSARSVRQRVDTANDIVAAFDGITYSKGASLLAMFEHYVGADVFQHGVREYLSARAYGNATTADFVAAIGAAAGQDLGAAFSSFLDQPGAPELDVRLACADGRPRIELAQHRYVSHGSPEPPPGQPWIVPVCVAFERAGKRAEACTLLDQARGEIALATKTCPRWVMPNVGDRGYYRARTSPAQLTALRDEAWPLLGWPERRDVFFEARAAVYDAALPLQLALSLVPRMLAGGDRFTIDDAVGLPSGLAFYAPDELRGKYEAVMRAMFGPGATRLGLLPKDGDDYDAEVVRGTLVRAAVWYGREPELVQQAVELAARWRDLPHAMRGPLLDIAADASAELYERLLHDVRSEADRARRDDIWHALSTVRAPERLDKALPLLLDPAVDAREAIALLTAASTEATRALVERFAREHLDALLARLPRDEVTGGAAELASAFTSACDGKRRDELADYVTKHFAPYPGGDRVVKQAIERMDHCIASRAVVDPELRAWLGGFRLPRPDAKKPDAKKLDANKPAANKPDAKSAKAKSK
jgi:alanyl aminopeptidase